MVSKQKEEAVLTIRHFLTNNFSYLGLLYSEHATKSTSTLTLSNISLEHEAALKNAQEKLSVILGTPRPRKRRIMGKGTTDFQLGGTFCKNDEALDVTEHLRMIVRHTPEVLPTLNAICKHQKKIAA